jgi:hypothetical protein
MFLDDGQIKLLARHAAIIGKRPHLLGQLSAAFDSVAKFLVDGGVSGDRVLATNGDSGKRAAFELMANRFLRTPVAQRGDNLAIETVAVFKKASGTRRFGGATSELRFIVNAGLAKKSATAIPETGERHVFSFAMTPKLSKMATDRFPAGEVRMLAD